MGIRYCEPVDRDNESAILEEMKRLDIITEFHQFSKDALYDAEVWQGTTRFLAECRVRTTANGKPMTSTTFSTVKCGIDKYEEACRQGIDNYWLIVQYPDRCMRVPFVLGLKSYRGVQHDRRFNEAGDCVDLPLENAVELWAGTVAAHKTNHLLKGA